MPKYGRCWETMLVSGLGESGMFWCPCAHLPQDRLDVQNLVDILLAKWNSLPAAEQPPHLGERLEELFLEASMLEAVSTPLAVYSCTPGWASCSLQRRQAAGISRCIICGDIA